MTSLSSRRRRRSALAVALALAAASTLSACGAPTPQTAREYAASDGVNLTLGTLDAGNLLVLTAAEGAPGTVLGSLSNTGEAAMTVQIGQGDAVTSVEVPAQGTVLLGPEHTAVPIASVPAPPGALTELSVNSDVAGSTTLQVPVLDGTLAEYASLVPSL